MVLDEVELKSFLERVLVHVVLDANSATDKKEPSFNTLVTVIHDVGVAKAYFRLICFSLSLGLFFFAGLEELECLFFVAFEAK